MNRRNSGTPDDIHSSQRRAPSRHMMSSGQLDVALIVMGLDPSTTVRRHLLARAGAVDRCCGEAVWSWIAGLSVGSRGKKASRPASFPPAASSHRRFQRPASDSATRQSGLVRIRRAYVRRECQLTRIRTTRLAGSRRAAGERLAPLDSPDLAGSHRPFLPACAAAPRSYGHALDDRHLGCHRAEGVAEFATGGESGVETGGHLLTCLGIDMGS